MGEQLVFVYGTLLSGESNHKIIKDSECICDNAEIVGYVMHALGGFPGIIHTGKDYDTIKGEIYKVDDETFKRLDMLEGYPNFYNRKEEIVFECDASDDYWFIFHDAWVYFLSSDSIRPNEGLIPSGNWREYSRSHA